MFSRLIIVQLIIVVSGFFSLFLFAGAQSATMKVSFEEEIKTHAGNQCCKIKLLSWAPAKMSAGKIGYYFYDSSVYVPLGYYNKSLRFSDIFKAKESSVWLALDEYIAGGSKTIQTIKQFNDCGKLDIPATNINYCTKDDEKDSCITNLNIGAINAFKAVSLPESTEKDLRSAIGNQPLSDDTYIAYKTERIQSCPDTFSGPYFTGPKEFKIEWQNEETLKIPVQNTCKPSSYFAKIDDAYNIIVENGFQGYTLGSGESKEGKPESWQFSPASVIKKSENNVFKVTVKPGAKFCKGKSYWCFYLKCLGDPSKIGYDCITIQTQTDGVDDTECDEFLTNIKTPDAPSSSPYKGTSFQFPETKSLDLVNTDLQTFIGRAIKTAMGIIGTIALIMIIYGGGLWMLAAGNSEREGKAMKIMFTAGIGVVIILSSYAIVQFVFSAI